MNPDEIYNVAIVGGGVVGSSLAAALKVPRICIIDKDWDYVDTIIGELLQPGGIVTLQKLGLENCLEKIDAVPSFGYCMFSEFGKVIVNFPKKCSLRAARCFDHGRFVAGLRREALKNRDVTKIEGVVTNLLTSDGGARVTGLEYNTGRDTPSKKILANLVVVANGCFSRLRPTSLSRCMSLSSWYAGFLVKDSSLPVEGLGNIAYGSRGNMLMYRISPDAFRVLVCIDEAKISSDVTEKTIEVIESCSDVIPEKAFQCILAAASEQRIKILPNYQLPSSKPRGKGVVYAGDALTIRHPVAGGGMTVGLNDAYILSRLLTQGVFSSSDTTPLDAAIDIYYRERLAVANVMNIFSHGLYNLGRNVSEGHRILRTNFLKYEVQNSNRDYHLYFMSGYVEFILSLNLPVAFPLLTS